MALVKDHLNTEVRSFLVAPLHQEITSLLEQGANLNGLKPSVIPAGSFPSCYSVALVAVKDYWISGNGT